MAAGAAIGCDLFAEAWRTGCIPDTDLRRAMGARGEDKPQWYMELKAASGDTLYIRDRPQIAMVAASGQLGERARNAYEDMATRGLLDNTPKHRLAKQPKTARSPAIANDEEPELSPKATWKRVGRKTAEIALTTAARRGYRAEGPMIDQLLTAAASTGRLSDPKRMAQTPTSDDVDLGTLPNGQRHAVKKEQTAAASAAPVGAKTVEITLIATTTRRYLATDLEAQRICAAAETLGALHHRTRMLPDHAPIIQPEPQHSKPPGPRNRRRILRSDRQAVTIEVLLQRSPQHVDFGSCSGRTPEIVWRPALDSCPNGTYRFLVMRKMVLRHRAVRAAALFTILLAPVTLLVPTASAGNWYGATGSTGCGGNMQDNNDMTYHRDDSLSTAMYNAYAYVLNNSVLPTDIDLQPEQSSSNNNTDVVMLEANYTGWYCGYIWHGSPELDTTDPDDYHGVMVGIASCRRLSGSKCQSFNVYIDQSYEVTLGTNARRTLACHELGHTLGLAHPVGSGEQQSSSCTGSASALDYSDHDRGHINDNY